MKIGVNTWVWTSPFSTKEFHLIPKVKQMGFDILEVALDDASIIDAALLRKMTEDNGLSVTVCGAFGPMRDISSDDPAIRQMGIDYVTDSIRFAEKVGSTLFSGPVYSAVGKARMIPDEERKQQWDWCVANLRKLGKVASDAGVTMGIEPLNRFETDMITLAEHALRLIARCRPSRLQGSHRHLPRQYRGKEHPGRDPPGRKGQARPFPRLRERSRHSRHRPPGLGRHPRCAQGDRIRRPGGHRILHPRRRRDRQGRHDLAAAGAVAGRIGIAGSALPPRAARLIPVIIP